MGSFWIAQGTQLHVLWWPRGVGWGVGGMLKREGIYMFVYTHTHTHTHGLPTWLTHTHTHTGFPHDWRTHMHTGFLHHTHTHTHNTCFPRDWSDFTCMGFPGGAGGKEPTWQCRGCIPFQYSCLEKSMERGAWRATVHGVSKCRTQLKGLRMHAYILIADSCCCTAETNITL